MPGLFPPFDPEPEAAERPKRVRRIPIRSVIPNLVTLLSLCAGLTSIRMGFEGRFDQAVYAILARRRAGRARRSTRPLPSTPPRNSAPNSIPSAIFSASAWRRRCCCSCGISTTSILSAGSRWCCLPLPGRCVLPASTPCWVRTSRPGRPTSSPACRFRPARLPCCCRSMSIGWASTCRKRRRRQWSPMSC